MDVYSSLVTKPLVTKLQAEHACTNDPSPGKT